MATQSNFENCPKIYTFFNRKLNLVRKQTFSGKNYFAWKISFFLCKHNVVLDTIKLAFFHIFFFQNYENSYFICMVCLCMLWSMSDSLKVQKFKIINEKFCRKSKVCYFCYIICERPLKDKPGRFLCMHCKCKTVQSLVLWLTKALSLVFGCKQNPKFFRKEN